MGDADLDWDAISEACEPILTSRTAREWDIGAEKENIVVGREKCELKDTGPGKRTGFYATISSRSFMTFK